MLALPVIAALLAAQTPYAEDDAPFRLRGFRAGGGGVAILDVEGLAPSAEAGLELGPWDRLSLRLMVGTAMRVGWGTFYVAPELAFRPLRVEGGVIPYVALGVQAGTVNITPQARDVPLAEARAAAGGNDGPGQGPPGGAEAIGPTPLAFTIGPQATLGAEFLLTESIVLDVGLRYTMLRWEGDVYNAFGLVLTFVGPPR